LQFLLALCALQIAIKGSSFFSAAAAAAILQQRNNNNTIDNGIKRRM